MPTYINFLGTTNGTISYIYNALGQKVLKKVTENSVVATTDYLNGFQYKNSILQFFPTAEGYVNATEVMILFGGSDYKYDYVFNYTDHLGNVRLSYTKDATNNVLKILEENHYYAFGLKHTFYNSDALMVSRQGNEATTRVVPATPQLPPTYKYKYNGKELQEELGLNMYDYGARNYDPALGRWMNIDPLAEKSRRWSTYTYCYNNPLVFVDYDGMFATPPTEIFNDRGKKIGQDANGADGTVSIVADRDKSRQIEKDYKKNGVSSVEDVQEGVQTTKVVLNESIDVLNRTNANGGDKEERSIVAADGTIHKAPTGDAELSEMNGKTVIKSSTMEIPGGKGNTDIHSHPTKITGDVNSGLSGFSATQPGPADPSSFKENSLNIIVGNLGLPEIKVDPLNNKTQVNPSQGAVFYNSNAQPLLQLNKSALEKIAK